MALLLAMALSLAPKASHSFSLAPQALRSFSLAPPPSHMSDIALPLDQPSSFWRSNEAIENRKVETFDGEIQDFFAGTRSQNKRQDVKSNGIEASLLSRAHAPIFRLGSMAHAKSLALMASLIFVVRKIGPVADALERIFYSVPLGEIGKAHPPGFFPPLGMATWGVHILILELGLEFVGAFHALKTRATDASTRKRYNAGFWIFAMGHIQSVLILLSHALIGFNPSLEHALVTMEYRLIRTNIFGSGLAMVAGPWTLIPVFLGVVFEKIAFGGPLGCLLSTFSLASYLFVKEMPLIFRFVFLVLPIAKAMNFLPNGSLSDFNHGWGTFILTIIFGIMASSLNRKVIQREDTLSAP